MSMKKLTGLLSQHRKRKNTIPEPSHGTSSLFNAISSLPNEVLIPILRNIYPPGAFLQYNRYTNRGTVAFWDKILKANRLLVGISQISERFQQISAVILKELANATKAFSKGCDNWKIVNGVHQMYREDSKWQWGYSSCVVELDRAVDGHSPAVIIRVRENISQSMSIAERSTAGLRTVCLVRLDLFWSCKAFRRYGDLACDADSFTGTKPIGRTHDRRKAIVLSRRPSVLSDYCI